MPAWAPTATPWLLAFDIQDPKARRRLERLLVGLGFVSTQYSLRVAVLTPGELRRLKEGLRRFEGQVHHVVLLPLGEQAPKALVWGTPLGLAQVPWEGVPGHPSAIHVGYPA